ncbi:hypothetical protein [Streptobacillus moniliformis]|uniref:hypothetical protein n=1 Tax=Streptobacillus moniliformis TaxID=34105 RepID=UPI0007E48FAF|nr:hypothetical protein [Streptobacillus moniliformis]
MERKIINNFSAEINGVIFNNENLYRSVEFLLEQIEYKFGEVYNDKFVEELKSTINEMYLKHEKFSYFDLENEFYFCIKEADKFDEIQFKYFGNDWKIEQLNENLLNGIYCRDNLKWYENNDKNINLER